MKTGCPNFILETKLKMGWSKTVVDGTNSTGSTKVVATDPRKHGSGAGFKTGFSMTQAYYLRWQLGFSMLDLPDSLHSGVGMSVAPSIMALVAVAMALRFE